MKLILINFILNYLPRLFTIGELTDYKLFTLTK